jgi:hypothetical protein
MSAMAQYILVGIIVVVAFAVSAWKLMPARRRLALLVALDARAARHPALARWRARTLQPRIARAVGPGCSGCSVAPTRPYPPQ